MIVNACALAFDCAPDEATMPSSCPEDLRREAREILARVMPTNSAAQNMALFRKARALQDRANHPEDPQGPE